MNRRFRKGRKKTKLLLILNLLNTGMANYYIFVIPYLVNGFKVLKACRVWELKVSSVGTSDQV